MSRAPRFRPKEINVRPLTVWVPFPDDAALASLIADILGNKFAAMAPAEVIKLRNSFNRRHGILFAKQEALKQDPANRDIETGNRHAALARQGYERARKHRERQLEAAHANVAKDPLGVRMARMALQVVEDARAKAADTYIELTFFEPDELISLCDEIEQALLPTNPTQAKKLAARGWSSVVVRIAEEVIEPISGMAVDAQTISKAAYRARKKAKSG